MSGTSGLRNTGTTFSSMQSIIMFYRAAVHRQLKFALVSYTDSRHWRIRDNRCNSLAGAFNSRLDVSGLFNNRAGVVANTFNVRRISKSLIRKIYRKNASDDII